MAVNRARLKLLLILTIFVAPVVLATLAYKYWRPQHLSNYGELIEAVEFKPTALVQASGQAFDTASLRGKWLFVLVQAGGCDRACSDNLYLMRQVRLATGRDQDRIERLVIAAQPLSEPLLKEHAGLRQARYTNVDTLGTPLAQPDAAGHIYLVDPLGRFVLRYPQPADGGKMLKDVQRLLKYSQIG